MTMTRKEKIRASRVLFEDASAAWANGDRATVAQLLFDDLPNLWDGVYDTTPGIERQKLWWENQLLFSAVMRLDAIIEECPHCSGRRKNQLTRDGGRV